MGKAGKLRKRKRIEETLVVNKIHRTDDDEADINSDSSCEEDQVEAVSLAIAVIDAFSRRLDLYDSKQYKGIRLALAPLLRLQQTKFFEAPGQKPHMSDEDFALIVSNKAVAATASIIKYYCVNLEEFSSESLKPLRKSLHPLVTHTFKRTGNLHCSSVDILQSNHTISNVVSHCFRTGDYTGALSALYSLTTEEELDTHLIPRLGSLQRWVRDCDVASLTLSAVGQNNDLNEMSLLLLHAVLRVANLVRSKHSGQDQDRSGVKKPHSKASINIKRACPYRKAIKQFFDELVVLKAYACDMCLTENALNRLIERAAGESAGLREHLMRRDTEMSLTLAGDLESLQSAPHACSCALRSAAEFYRRVRVVSHVPGPLRRPPVAHDLNIFATAPGTISYSPTSPEEVKVNQDQARADSCPEHPYMTLGVSSALATAHPTRHDILEIPGAMLLSGVLSPLECAQFIVAAERLGYTPDSVDGIDNVVWLADESLLGPLYARVESLLPPVLEGHVLRGINARLRLFRYYQQAEYRPHIDGAWPGSGLLPNGEYTDDAFNGDRHSRLTFLVYLNDGFEGGTTTFFLPGHDAPPAGESADCAIIEEEGAAKKHTEDDKGGVGIKEVGVGYIEVRKVQPQMGAVLVFPHGSASGSLVHEGSAVTKGVKYVIRTDVLYSAKKVIV